MRLSAVPSRAGGRLVERGELGPGLPYAFVADWRCRDGFGTDTCAKSVAQAA